MSYSLNSLKGGYIDIGDYIGDFVKGDTRSLDYSSCESQTLDPWLGSQVEVKTALVSVFDKVSGR